MSAKVWRSLALMALLAACWAYARPDMIVAAGQSLWLCLQ